MTGTFERLVHGMGLAIGNLERSLLDDATAASFLNELGWSLPPGVREIGLRKLDPTDVLSALGVIATLNLKVSAGAGGMAVDADLASAFVKLIGAFTAFYKNLSDLPGALNAPASYVAATHIDTELIPRLIDLLIVDTLGSRAPLAFAIGAFCGVFRLDAFDDDPTVFQVRHLRRVVHWDRIPRVFGDPKALFGDVYRWGFADCDANGLAISLGSLLQIIGVSNTIRALPRFAEERLAGVSVPKADTDPATQVVVNVVRELGLTGGVNVGLTTFGLRPTSPGATDAGIGVAPFLIGTTAQSFPLLESLKFVLDATVDLTSGVVLALRGGRGATLKTGFNAGPVGSPPDGHFRAGLSYEKASGEATNLVALGDVIRLEGKQFALTGGADVSGGVLGPTISAQFTGGRFVVDGSQMDSFLSKLIPVSIDVGFDFGVGWSGAYGFFFEGSASPAVTVGLHESLGPFTLETLHAELAVNGGQLAVELSLSGQGSLGPFQFTVDRIGISVAVAFHSGNLGPLDFSLGFKPPNGLGVMLDAGLITGGGYLYIDNVKHRYAGVLECSIAGIVQVKIIAVLDTVLPDGRPEFSLLLVITTNFPPIQLSFGFTLSGVGGLGGMNRTMSIDALRTGQRAHSLNSVLFPTDPIKNAPKIISDLSRFFPPADGRYVFGPMFALGWGTPNLITLKVGVILEVPDPIRLAILGLVDLALPSDDFPLVSIHIDVLGTVDFGTKILSILGSMYDSHVTVYSVSGDMALLLSWGDNPNFAFSVGGLNPRFSPPPNFPQMNRSRVSIGDGDNPRLSSDSYFAVTTNSLQFGASVDLYAAAGGFSIHGHVGFDALFIVSPFSFVIEFAAGLDVEFHGHSLCSLHVDGMVAGPRPWHVHGHASFHILFIDVSASVDVSWGDRDPVVLPSVEVLPALKRALSDPQSWNTVLPTDVTHAVSLASRPPGDHSLVVHPIGSLQVREKVVPFDQPITKFGNARPSDGTLFTISSVQVDSKPETLSWLTDEFAIGQYTDLTNDQQITAQSYQPMRSGITIGSGDVVVSRDVPCVVGYTDGYLEADDRPLRISRFALLPAALHDSYSRLGAGFVSATRTKGLTEFTEPGTLSAVKTTGPTFVVAHTDDLKVRADILGSPATQIAAMTALSAHLAANPEDRGALQVIGLHEVPS